MAKVVKSKSELTELPDFKDILNIIDTAKMNAYRAVNKELINMYWNIGEYVSCKVKTGKWGKSIVAELANYLQRNNKGNNGFSVSNLWRMKQYYEIYAYDSILATLSREFVLLSLLFYFLFELTV